MKIFFLFMYVTGSLAASKLYQNACQQSTADYFGSFQEFDALSSLICSMTCVKKSHCLGFQYKGNICKLVSYFWEDDIDTILDLDFSNCFVDSVIAENDYILNKQLNIYFKFYDTPLTRQNASQQCITDSSILLTIDSQAKNDFVRQLKGILKIDKIYIGASDIANEGDWRWEDGSPVVYHFFYSQQPNNNDRDYPSEQAHCAVFALRWDDVYCGKAYPFICQKT